MPQALHRVCPTIKKEIKILKIKTPEVEIK